MDFPTLDDPRSAIWLKNKADWSEEHDWLVANTKGVVDIVGYTNRPPHDTEATWMFGYNKPDVKMLNGQWFANDPYAGGSRPIGFDISYFDAYAFLFDDPREATKFKLTWG